MPEIPKWEDTLPADEAPPAWEDTVSVDEPVEEGGILQAAKEKAVRVGERAYEKGKEILTLPMTMQDKGVDLGEGRRFIPDEPPPPPPPRILEKDRPGVDYTLPPQDPFASYVMPPMGSEKGVQPPPLRDPALETAVKTGQMAARATALPISTKAMKEEFPEYATATQGEEIAGEIAGYIMDIGALKKLGVGSEAAAFAITTTARELKNRLDKGDDFNKALDHATTEGLSEALLFGTGEVAVKAVGKAAKLSRARKTFKGPKTFANLPEEVKAGVMEEVKKVYPDAFKESQIKAMGEPALAFKEPGVGPVGRAKQVSKQAGLRAEAQMYGKRVEPKALLEPGPREKAARAAKKVYPEREMGKAVVGPAREAPTPFTKAEESIQRARKAKEVTDAIYPTRPKIRGSQAIVLGAAAPAGAGYVAMDEKQAERAKKIGMGLGAGLLAVGAARTPAGRKFLTKTLEATKPVYDVLRGRTIIKDAVRGFDPAKGPLGKTEAFIRKYWGYTESKLPMDIAESARSAREGVEGGHAMAKEFMSLSKLPPKQNAIIKKITTGQVTGTEPAFLSDAYTAGVKQSDINIARAYRTQANLHQEELHRLGLISEEAMRKHYGTYVKNIDRNYLGKPTFQTGKGGVKRIRSRKELSPEYAKENIIQEAGYPEAVGFGQDRIRVEMARHVDNVKTNPFVTLSDDVTEEVLKNVDPKKTKRIAVDGWTYRQLEGTPVKDLPESVEKLRKHVYGMRGLEGRWVLEPVAESIEEMFTLPGKLQSGLNILTQMRQTWKVGKAIINVPNTVGNLMYNSIILDNAMQKGGIWSKAGWRHGKNALNDIKTKSDLYLEQKALGTFGGHFARQEHRAILSKILEGSEELAGIDKFMARLQQFQDKAGTVYQLSEEWGKMALVRYGMEVEGMTAKQASRFAKKHLFDYADVPKSVQFLRRMPFGPAFITFPTKAIPRAMEYAVNTSNPLRFWKYPMALWAVGEMNRARLGWSKEKVADELRNLPPWAREVQVLVGKDKNGRGIFWDPRYVTPFMDAWGTREEIPFVGLLFGGGPEKAIAELVVNRQLYGDRPIIRSWEYDTPGQKAQAVGKHVFRALAPQAAVSLYNIYEAASGAKGYTGEKKRILWQEIARAVGVPVHISRKGTVDRRIRNEQRELSEYIRRVERDKSINPQKKLGLVKQAIEKFNKRLNKIKE